MEFEDAVSLTGRYVVIYYNCIYFTLLHFIIQAMDYTICHYCWYAVDY